jgi:hypothetical protein
LETRRGKGRGCKEMSRRKAGKREKHNETKGKENGVKQGMRGK